MIRYLFLCLISVYSTSGFAADPWFKEFAQKTQKKAQSKNLPGYTFAFVEKGKPASVVVYGKDKKIGTPIDQDTVFRLASVSKTFTSMLIAKYVDHKELAWADPVADFAPQFELVENGRPLLSLQHVIGQSSGYTPNAYDNLIEANYPVERVLTMLAGLKPLCNPGQCYTYQNTLFAVVEEFFIQHKSSYAEALQNTLIKPLKMPFASVGKSALQSAKKWAKPHVAISKNGWRASSVRDDYYRYSPAAGVNASIRDMIIWMRALLGEYPDVVSPALVKQVTSPLVKSKKELYRRHWRSHLSDAHYGLGWRVYEFDGEALNYHGGWVKGYRADIAFAPEFGVGYIMLMNAESNLINELTPDFWQRYFKHAKQTKLSAANTQ
ncbi:serine hydrolase domain-containing protein [Paraglaciecola aquimarina]|uniref:Serine hydrolase domain-containing protein n=1 Tax=Paraglaciecola aquimarina TaxID=1235557 RepID=A0ABU3SUU1_9ALTE|nr:serine hydrolase domain-containing protein [Paraglaciecola aquimarina]MDU0353789.1 serine hydrolase domain-containing protein [Paraglaciecola aquimarina]